MSDTNIVFIKDWQKEEIELLNYYQNEFKI